MLEEIEAITVEAQDFKLIILEQIVKADKAIGQALLASVLALFEKNSKYLPVLLGENGDPLFRNRNRHIFWQRQTGSDLHRL